MRFLPAGDQALLIELPDLPQTMQLYRALSAAALPGVHELVPAARTLLVHFHAWQTTAQALARAIHGVQAALQTTPLLSQSGSLAATIEIPVHYDGEDLPEVAQLLGISVAQVIERHTAQPYDAAFAGFAPGFVYLSGGAHLYVPRRKSPRTKVPAGAVALGGNFSAVYPHASPGGWQLVGHTDMPMWDLTRQRPAYIQPGDKVQFIDVARHQVHVSLPGVHSYPPDIKPEHNHHQPPKHNPEALAAIEFLSVGMQTLVQDAGRQGLSSMGVSASGALDRQSMRDANALVGNPVHTPVLENLLGQLRMQSHGCTTLAVAGAQVSITITTPHGKSWALDAPSAVALNDGDILHIAAPSAGMRCYIAVRGGWQVLPVLGSCSTDTLAHIGPAALHAGQCLPVGSVPAAHLRAVASAPLPIMRALPKAGETVVLDVVLGPRTDWFTPQALQLLQTQLWAVTPQSSRIGIRLQGQQALARVRHDELPSEGTVAGAIQVPMNGQPVLFLADHPLTGGYPVIAAVASHHLDLAAQIPVGCKVRFNVLQACTEIEQ